MDDGSGNIAMVSKEAMAAAVASASKKVRMIFLTPVFRRRKLRLLSIRLRLLLE